MSARQRARLSQIAVPEKVLQQEGSESEDEEESTVRKPAFVFDNSDSDSDSSSDSEGPSSVVEKEAGPEDDFVTEEDSDDKLGADLVDESSKKTVPRERNSNFARKKKEVAVKSVNTEKEKGGDPDGMSFDELSELICNSEASLLSSTLLEKEKGGPIDPDAVISNLFKVDVKGLDIDAIMKKRFGGMAVDEMPAAAQQGGAQQRRFAAAVANTEKARARIAKLSNKVRL